MRDTWLNLGQRWSDEGVTAGTSEGSEISQQAKAQQAKIACGPRKKVHPKRKPEEVVIGDLEKWFWDYGNVSKEKLKAYEYIGIQLNSAPGGKWIICGGERFWSITNTVGEHRS